MEKRMLWNMKSQMSDIRDARFIQSLEPIPEWLDSRYVVTAERWLAHGGSGDPVPAGRIADEGRNARSGLDTQDDSQGGEAVGTETHVNDSTQMTTLSELHEAATPAPWTDATDKCGAGIDGDDGSTWVASFCDAPDVALVVALRNAYADGTLVERSKVDALMEAAWQLLAVTTGGAAIDMTKPSVFASMQAALAALEER
jgi:hypothetical protein